MHTVRPRLGVATATRRERFLESVQGLNLRAWPAMHSQGYFTPRPASYAEPRGPPGLSINTQILVSYRMIMIRVYDCVQS
jgi:hypothetical protein